MRKSAIRAFVGSVAFTLPIPGAVIGVCLDHSSLSHDPTVGALVPPVLFSCVALADVVRCPDHDEQAVVAQANRIDCRDVVLASS